MRVVTAPRLFLGRRSITGRGVLDTFRSAFSSAAYSGDESDGQSSSDAASEPEGDKHYAALVNSSQSLYTTTLPFRNHVILPHAGRNTLGV